jgi:NADH-quinone oxidoreductase subunit E
MGGDAIFERLTDDGSITLEHVECNAACDFAPVVMVNWEFMDNQTPESATQLVDDLRAGNEVRSTRGPRICTWREAERVLAGYPDGLADEGPSGGPATMVGLQIARENGWSAPESSRKAVSTGSTSDKGVSTKGSAADGDRKDSK